MLHFALGMSLLCAALVAGCSDEPALIGGVGGTGGAQAGTGGHTSPEDQDTGGATGGGGSGSEGGTPNPNGADASTNTPPDEQITVPAPVATGCVTDVSAGKHAAMPCDGITHDLTVPEMCLGIQCGLIVDLHGGTMTGQMQAENTEIDVIGAERGFVVVHPNAINQLWVAGTDDLRVITFIEDLIAAFHLDDKRVHMTGFSQGGYMTWRFLCEHADLLASAAPASAAEMGAILLPEVGCPFNGTEPTDDQVDILFMFASQDALVMPPTGIAQHEAVLAHYGLELTESVMEDPQVRWNRYGNASGMTYEFIHHDYVTDGAVVLPLGGHCYPGSDVKPFGCNPPTAFHWGEAVVDFFERHPR